tara:strand:+ start:3741 stop:5762 length:2022 start_codon:yes stop_codon:yes gene_type:complete
LLGGGGEGVSFGNRNAKTGAVAALLWNRFRAAANHHKEAVYSTLSTPQEFMSPTDETPLPPPEGYTVLQEGKARILTMQNDVFYNKAQVVNRDISLAVMRQFQKVRAQEHASDKRPPKNKRNKGNMCATPRDSHILPHLLNQEEIDQMFASPEDHAQRMASEKEQRENDDEPTEKDKPPLRPIRILEGMAASGLRAIRYARELTDVGCVVANDLDPSAIEAIKRNKEFNAAHSGDAKAQMEKVICAGQDVRMLMMQHEKMFDAVDLDPYGTPSTLLDGAVQAIGDGGLLCVTATDMAVLCGNNGEVCWTKYGSYPLRAKYCHEQAVRVLLSSIDAAAGRYKRHIVPVLSVHIDFYVRCFVRVYSSALEAKLAPTKVSYVFQCAGCDTFELQPVGKCVTKHNSTKHQVGDGPVVPQRCPHCGWGFHMGGPFWTEPIHDMKWVGEIKTQVEGNKQSYPGYDKIHALLTTVQEELVDAPLHYDIHAMSMTLKATPPPMALFRSAVINAGYRVSPAHCNPLAVKTDAPTVVLWDLLRCWIKEHPVKPQATKTPGEAILATEPTTIANWQRHNGAFTKAQRDGVTRCVIAPLPNPGRLFYLSAGDCCPYIAIHKTDLTLFVHNKRYPNNPSSNWGPKARAGRHLMDGQHPGVEGTVGPNGNAKGTAHPEPKRRKREEK